MFVLTPVLREGHEQQLKNTIELKNNRRCNTITKKLE